MLILRPTSPIAHRQSLKIWKPEEVLGHGWNKANIEFRQVVDSFASLECLHKSIPRPAPQIRWELACRNKHQEVSICWSIWQLCTRLTHSATARPWTVEDGNAKDWILFIHHDWSLLFECSLDLGGRCSPQVPPRLIWLICLRGTIPPVTETELSSIPYDRLPSFCLVCLLVFPSPCTGGLSCPHTWHKSTISEVPWGASPSKEEHQNTTGVGENMSNQICAATWQAKK